MAAFQDRIVEFKRVKASELRANPKNWREHPERQQAAMRAILDEVGWAGASIARQTDDGLELIDGHLRAELDEDAEIPVLVLDVNEQEADKLLATFDPIGAMAKRNDGQLEAVLASLEAETEGLRDFVEWLSPFGSADLEDVPEQAIVPEQYGVIVVCEDETQQAAVYERLAGEGLDCRVVNT